MPHQQSGHGQHHQGVMKELVDLVCTRHAGHLLLILLSSRGAQVSARLRLTTSWLYCVGLYCARLGCARLGWARSRVASDQ